MRRQLAVRVDHSTQVHDSRDTLLFGRCTEQLGEEALLFLESLALVESVQQIKRDVDGRECVFEVAGIECVTVDHLDVVDPGVVAQARRVANENPHPVAVIEKFANESPADVPGRTSDKHARGGAVE